MKRHAIYLTVFGLMQTAFAADYGSYVGELGKLGAGTATNMMQPAQYTPRYTDNVPMAEQYYGGGVSLPTQFGSLVTPNSTTVKICLPIRISIFVKNAKV